MEQVSWIRRASRIGTLVTVSLFGRYVGEDSFGNRYYESRKGRARRWVLYAGEAEATKVPPEWFGWLHHTAAHPLPSMCDQPLPNTTSRRYVWQRPHVPNLTGTEAAPLPSGYGLNMMIEGKQARVAPFYRAWGPEQDKDEGGLYGT